MSVYNETSMYNGQDPVDTEVHHDSTLSGDGSADNPLSVNFPATNVEHDSTLSGDGSADNPLSVNFPATNVEHDSTLSGDGSADDPLSVNFPATNVEHDSTLSGDGSADDPLKVSTVSSITSGDTSNVPTADAVYKYSAAREVYKGVDPDKRLYGIDGNGNAGSNVFLKIATLPQISYQGGGGMICIEGVVGGWNSETQAVISLKIGTRNAIQFKFIIINGTYDSGKVTFALYEETDGTYSLYLKRDGFYLYDLNMHAQSGAELSYSETIVTPSGTLVADTTSYYNSVVASNTGVGSVEQSVFVDSDGQVKPCPRNRVVAKSSSFMLNNEYTGSMIGEVIKVINSNNSTITVSYIDINQTGRQLSINAGMYAEFICTDNTLNCWAGNKSI